MNDATQKIQAIIAKAWNDDAFKQKLIDEPKQTLANEGIELPDDKTITVLVDTDQVSHLVIPNKPNDLNDQELENTAGGICWTYCCGCF